MAGCPHGRDCLHNPAPRRPGRAFLPYPQSEEQEPMNKLLTAILAAAFAASPVYAQTTAAPAKDEKKAEVKKDEKKAEEKKTTEAKKEEKKKPKGGC
jgi:hypothetical protein